MLLTIERNRPCSWNDETRQDGGTRVEAVQNADMALIHICKRH